MNKALFAIALLLAGYANFELLYPDVTIRYRLTLIVQADGQTHEGSGVIQVSYAKVPQLLGASATLSVKVKGEAVAVDLGPRGVLFALLKGGSGPRSGPEWVVPNVFGAAKGGFGPEAFAQIDALRGITDLPPPYMPLLVRFRNTGDPETVEQVDAGNLAALFGAGVRLARATIQVTRDPITRGIERRLPWVEGLRGKYITGSGTSRGVPLGLHEGHFRRKS